MKYSEMLGLGNISDLTNIPVEERNMKQKKAIKNIKYASDSEWQFVNSWYDEKSENAQDYFKHPQVIFNSIYNNSLNEVFDCGMECWNDEAQKWIKDIRFCGKDFLQKVVFIYTVRLLEEAVEEVELTEDEKIKVFEKLKEMYKNIK